MNFWVGLFKTIVSLFTKGPVPTQPVVPAPVTPKPTPVNPTPKPVPANSDQINIATGQKLILHETVALGPMPGTGGIIHVVPPELAKQIATLITSYAHKYKFPTMTGFLTIQEALALMYGWMRQESDFDPQALDPNKENWHSSNPTPEERLYNEDVGEAQFSWATLIALPDMKGLTAAQVLTKAEDPNWAVDAMFKFCQTLISNAVYNMTASKALALYVPNGDPLYLGIQSYNSGETGALLMAQEKGKDGNWAYAVSVANDMVKWLPLFVN